MGDCPVLLVETYRLCVNADLPLGVMNVITSNDENDRPHATVNGQATKDGKQTIMQRKEHFKDQGWQMSWGYDLCPECAKTKQTNG